MRRTTVRLASRATIGELCIAHRDPGHPNWLDTAGHRAGYILLRALLAEGEWPEVAVEILYEHEWEARRDSV